MHLPGNVCNVPNPDFRQARVERSASLPYVAFMFFTKIDDWLGKTLFIPPIIKFCQVTRQSQWAVARLFWFIAALDGFYRAETLFSSLLWGGMSVFMMITATRRADSPTVSFMFFRLLAFFMFGLDLMRAAVTGAWAGVEFWVFVLIAEYAATIRTVPPSEPSKRSVTATPQR